MLPSDHLHHFQSQVRRVRRLLARQIDLSKKNLVPKTELEAIYELAFLNVFVAFENDLIELLKTNLLVERDSFGRRISLFVPRNRPLAEKLLIGTNKYFQILPVEQMEKISKVYLKDGGPFVTLDAGQKLAVSKAYAIRNHIAHRSSESKNSFSKKISSQVNLPKQTFSPGYYLKSRISQNVTYFDHHVAEIGGALRQICDNS